MAIERRAGAPRLIEWTGERCVPWTPDIQVVYEHYHRYLWVAELVRGKRVLDVASGEGFGSAILAEHAKHVTGIDLDPTTVEHSQLNYAAANLEYRVGSALELDVFEPDSFDVVVVFELIEHVTDQAAVLAGIDRVLAPGGVLVISTPDRRMYSEATGQHNPFHEHELTEPELRELLGEHFARVRLYGQRATAGSRLVALDPEQPRTTRPFGLRRVGGDWRATGEPAAMYLIAVAARRSLPKLPTESTLSDYELTLVHEHLVTADQLRQQIAQREQLLLAKDGEREHAVAEKQAELLAKAHELLDALERERNLAAQLEGSADHVARLQAELDERRAEARARVQQLEQEVEDRQRVLEEVMAGHEEDRIALRRVHESVVWGAFQRARGRLYGTLGGSDSRRAKAVQWSLRKAGRSDGAVQAPHDAPALEVAPASAGPVYDQIHFPSYEQPLVSLVVSAYVGADVTYACLRSIADWTEGPSYEVVVVDDAADEDNAVLWQHVEGANVLVNDPGIGYLRSVNRGVDAARGRYVVLMNNDVEVATGWLRGLVRRLESAPDVAAVAPKLMYPDGSMQEAGAIVFQDGHGWNYGRGQDPDGHEFNYVREIDYGSAACLLVRRDAWTEVGGYDERFLPMYYEDADLCFALRAAGHRVLYEPTVRIVHHEGASAGTDLESGGKRHQELNRPKFVEKWRSRLERDHLRMSHANVRRASNRVQGPHVLVIDHRVPAADHDAGSLRMLRLMETLLELGCRVTFAPADMAPHQPYTSQLQALGIDVVYGPTWIGEEIARIGSDLQLAIVSRPYVAAQYTHMLREHAPAATIAYDTVDLHYVREQRRADLGEPHAAAKAETLRQLELGMVRGCDVTLVVSDEEREQLEAEAPGSTVLVVPVVNDVVESVPPLDRRSGVLFVGGFGHPPNEDAAVRLVRSVMPLVWQQLGEVRVTIAGANPTPAVEALASPKVDVTGWVEDLQPLIDGARLMAAPLRYGAGMKGKITQSLGAGLPVVTTPTGAEGLGVEDGRELLIADDPADLAERIVRLHTDDELWRRLSAEGQQVVRRTASLEVMRERLQALLALAR